MRIMAMLTGMVVMISLNYLLRRGKGKVRKVRALLAILTLVYTVLLVNDVSLYVTSNEFNKLLNSINEGVTEFLGYMFVFAVALLFCLLIGPAFIKVEKED